MLKRIIKYKWLVLAAITIVIALIVFIYSRQLFKTFGYIVGSIGTLALAKKSISSLSDVISGEKLTKMEIQKDVEKNTVDDNFEFGVEFIKRRRNKSTKK